METESVVTGVVLCALSALTAWAGWSAGARMMRGEPNEDPNEKPPGIIWLGSVVLGLLGVAKLLAGFGFIPLF